MSVAPNGRILIGEVKDDQHAAIQLPSPAYSMKFRYIHRHHAVGEELFNFYLIFWGFQSCLERPPQDVIAS